MDNLLTPKDIAKALGLQPETIVDYIKKGFLPATRLQNRMYRIDPRDFKAFLGRREKIVVRQSALEEIIYGKG